MVERGQGVAVKHLTSGDARPARLGVAGLLAWLAACGSPIGHNPDGFDFGTRGDAGPMPGVDASRSRRDAYVKMPAMPDATSLPDTGPVVDCPPSATLIYVTGDPNEDDPGSDLYSFNPQSGAFTLVGSMGCLSSPTHMTVDRTGSAWVVANGLIYKASTETAKCAAVATWKADPVNFPDFALTFLGTTSAPDTSLYILSDTGELAVFDVATGSITKMGTLSIPSPAGDMTTNGDGTLYFLQQAASQTLNEVDPSNASILTTWTTGQNSMDTQALAYYGGLFYDFIGDAVYTYDTTSKTTKSIGTAPIFVTGAGQSTCVPGDAGPPDILK